MLDLNLLKNQLYNTSVLLLVTITLTEQLTNLQNIMIDIVLEVRHVITIQTTIIHYKIDIALTLQTDTDMTELLLLHNSTDQDMTTSNAIHVPIVLHTDLHTDHHINKIHAIDVILVPTLEIDNFHSTIPHVPSYRNG